MQLWLSAVGDSMDEEEDQKEEEVDSTTLLSSSSFHTMMVRRGKRGSNHTRTSKDKVDHWPTRIPRTAGKRRMTKHHQPLL